MSPYGLRRPAYPRHSRLPPRPHPTPRPAPARPAARVRPVPATATAVYSRSHLAPLRRSRPSSTSAPLHRAPQEEHQTQPAGRAKPRRKAARRSNGSRATAHHRRGRPHPLRRRGRQPVLPARLRPLRTNERDRHLQQAVRAVGRGVRRRHRRRRHDRPPRPPRRGRQPQKGTATGSRTETSGGCQQTTQREQARPPGGQLSAGERGVNIRPALTALKSDEPRNLGVAGERHTRIASTRQALSPLSSFGPCPGYGLARRRRPHRWAQRSGDVARPSSCKPDKQTRGSLLVPPSSRDRDAVIDGGSVGMCGSPQYLPPSISSEKLTAKEGIGIEVLSSRSERRCVCADGRRSLRSLRPRSAAEEPTLATCGWCRSSPRRATRRAARTSQTPVGATGGPSTPTHTTSWEVRLRNPTCATSPTRPRCIPSHWQSLARSRGLGLRDPISFAT